MRITLSAAVLVGRAWESLTLTCDLKTRIFRILIKEIVVNVDGAASEVMLVIHCNGGARTKVRAR